MVVSVPHRRRGQQRGNEQRAAVQRREGMEVVELEALDEGAVEHRGRGCAGGVAGADHDGVAAAFQVEDGVGGDARPGQLGADQGASQAVQQQVLGPLDDMRRDVVQVRSATQVASRPVGPSGSVAACVHGGHQFSRSSHLACCYIHITTERLRKGGGVEALTTVLSTDAGVPLHRQLFLVLHDEIDRGVIAPGDALPTEQTLCDQFGVSRITVRRALADLAEQGYIERRQGVGSFVREHAPSEPVSAGRSYHGWAAADAVRDRGRSGRTRHATPAAAHRRGARDVPASCCTSFGCGGNAGRASR